MLRRPTVVSEKIRIMIMCAEFPSTTVHVGASLITYVNARPGCALRYPDPWTPHAVTGMFSVPTYNGLRNSKMDD